jgi:hypothetical protein
MIEVAESIRLRVVNSPRAGASPLGSCGAAEGGPQASGARADLPSLDEPAKRSVIEGIIPIPS